ncbi:MAG: hypothetical protein WDW38_001796 [Sanguina aurantia]
MLYSQGLHRDSLIIAHMKLPPVPSLWSQTCLESSGMVLSSDTDLMTLMQCIPPLLRACVNNSCVAYEGERTDFKAFRLVSKEASRLALTAITTCRLSLTGQASDTSMDIVGLLCEAQLETLHVKLRLTDTFNPAATLTQLVAELEPQLNSVTSLYLFVSTNKEHGACRASSEASAPSGSEEGSDDLAEPADEKLEVDLDLLVEAQAALVAACSDLDSLTYDGDLSPELLQELAEACPYLYSLDMSGGHGEDEDGVLDNLQEAVLLLPSLLPHVVDLTLSPRIIESGWRIPNMSLNTGIVALVVEGAKMETDEDWLRLPPNLEHLTCFYMETGPPAGLPGARPLLARLERIAFTYRGANLFGLADVARLLRAAPALRRFGFKDHLIGMALPLREGATAASAYADLALLSQKLDVKGLHDATLTVYRSDGQDDDASVQSFLAGLPQVKGVKRCQFSGLSCKEVTPFLKAFPDTTFQPFNLQPPGQQGQVCVHSSGCAAVSQRERHIDFVTAATAELVEERGSTEKPSQRR